MKPEAASKTFLLKEVKRLQNSVEHAWGVIANAGGGDWQKESAVWRKAAMRWRDEDWHPMLDRIGYAPRRPVKKVKK